MNKQEFAPIFEALCVMYPNRLLPGNASREDKAEIARVWYSQLSKIPAAAVQAAIDSLGEDESIDPRYPPTVPQVKRLAKKLAGVQNWESYNEGWDKPKGEGPDKLRGDMFQLTEQFYQGEDLDAEAWEKLIQQFYDNERPSAGQHAAEVLARLEAQA